MTVYLLFTPAALVSQLLWVAPFVSAFVTLFFYGFFILGTKILLDPFSSAVGAEEGGFDTSSFFEDTVEIVEGINSRVGLHACALPNPVQTRQAAAGHVSEGWMCCAQRQHGGEHAGPDGALGECAADLRADQARARGGGCGGGGGGGAAAAERAGRGDTEAAGDDRHGGGADVECRMTQVLFLLRHNITHAACS